MQTDGKLLITGENAAIENLDLQTGTNYPIEIYYNPEADAKTCLFDIVQIDQSTEKSIGGERFVFDPEYELQGEERGQASTKIEEQQILVITLNPVPAMDFLEVRIGPMKIPGTGRLILYHADGRLAIQESVSLAKEGTILRLNVGAFSQGLYLLQILNAEGSQLASSRFQKF